MAKKVNQSIRTTSERQQAMRGVLRGNSLAVRVAAFLIMSSAFLVFLAITDKRQPAPPLARPTDSSAMVSDSTPVSDSL